MPSKTNSIALLFLLILPWSSFGQIDDFFSYASNRYSERIESNIFENKLYIFESRPINGAVVIKMLDEQYNLIEEKVIYGAHDFMQLEDGTIYILTAKDFDYDIAIFPPKFSIDIFDANLNQLGQYSIDNLTADDLHTHTTGRFVLLPNGNIFIAYRNWRIIFNTVTKDYSVKESDDFYFNIDNIGVTPDSNILVQVNEDSYYKIDQNGFVLDSMELYNFQDWLFWKNNLHGAVDNNLYVYNSDFDKIDSLSFSQNINGLNISASDKLHIISNFEVFEMQNVNSVPTILLTNNNEEEKIIESFVFADSLGLLLFKNVQVPVPSHQHLCARKVAEISNQDFADLKIDILSVEPSYYFTGSLDFHVSLITEYEIENLGDHPISSFYLVSSGNCQYVPSAQLGYCTSTRISLDESIEPGEKAVFTHSSYWDWVISLDVTYNLCISAFNPNFQYDKDYSQNHACTSIFLSTTDNINYSDQFTLYPNPTNDVITLRFPEDVQAISDVHIYNCQNQLMLYQKNISTNGSDQVELNTSDFPAGIYWLQGETDEGILSKKFVKVD